MQLVLLDEPLRRENLKPFTLTRPISQIRCGILTLAEKWAHYLGQNPAYLTEGYLQAKYPHREASAYLLINAALLPNPALVAEIRQLPPQSVLVHGPDSLAWHLSSPFRLEDLGKLRTIASQAEIQLIQYLPDIFALNGAQIAADFQLLTQGRRSAFIQDPHTVLYGAENIFVEEGVKIKAAVLNAESGFIYLGKNAQVQEGSLIQGNFALGEGAVLNPGAKMRGDTTIGPYCKVGGEVSNSVFFGYSNKAHDGFLGNSVLGEWCNLGADTNTSNLKNNYGPVKIWNYAQREFMDTGRTFCGLMMGDHSKAGINTMFNTGTVVGVSANVFGAGFPPKFVPSFSWGGADGWETFALDKALEVARRMMARRNRDLDEIESQLLTEVFAQETPSKP
ncbi:MAG: glucose-1-phosphate thymidylyltransferase [Microscillaceae bacterium]|nr:glucose-1-phosphate thymidylyltransferase [Microscillaceae bacterium]